MGLRGPAPTPTAILRARGSWRADERPGEVNFDSDAPTCPAFLSAEAKAEWKRQVKQLQKAGILQVVDRVALACWCEAWGEFAATTKKIEEDRQEALTVATLDHPLLNAKNKAVERILKLAAQFGFTPSARVRITTQEHKEEASGGKSRFFAS